MRLWISRITCQRINIIIRPIWNYGHTHNRVIVMFMVTRGLITILLLCSRTVVTGLAYIRD